MGQHGLEHLEAKSDRSAATNTETITVDLSDPKEARLGRNRPSGQDHCTATAEGINRDLKDGVYGRNLQSLERGLTEAVAKYGDNQDMMLALAQDLRHDGAADGLIVKLSKDKEGDYHLSLHTAGQDNGVEIKVKPARLDMSQTDQGAVKYDVTASAYNWHTKLDLTAGYPNQVFSEMFDRSKHSDQSLARETAEGLAKFANADFTSKTVLGTEFQTQLDMAARGFGNGATRDESLKMFAESVTQELKRLNPDLSISVYQNERTGKLAYQVLSGSHGNVTAGEVQ